MALSEAAEAKRRPHFLWPHLLFATLLSLFVPYLGAAYLGLPARDAANDWQRRTVALSIIMMAIILLPHIWHFELLLLLLIGGFWIVFGAASAFAHWRVALRDPATIRIVPGWLSVAMLIVNIAVFSLLALQQMRLPAPLFIFAPDDTPLVKAGETLYGFKYDPHKIHLQRGQLVLASVNYEPTLVRMIAVPGDIFVPGTFAINVNATSITLTQQNLSLKAHVGWALKDIVEALNDPDNSSYIARISDRSVKLSGANDTEPQILGRDTFIVARDEDLVDPKQPALPTTTIGREDIVSVPWGKFWSFGDYPGDQSDLVQPSVVFAD